MDLFGFAGHTTDSSGFPAPPGTEEHWSESCLYELKKLKTFTTNRLDHLESVFESNSGKKVPLKEKTNAKEVASVKASVEYLNSAFMVLEDKCLRTVDDLSLKLQELEQSSSYIRQAATPSSHSQSIDVLNRKLAVHTKRQETFELQSGTNFERVNTRLMLLQDGLKSIQENVSTLNNQKVSLTPREQSRGNDVVKRLDAIEIQIVGLETSLSNISQKTPISRLGLGSPNVSLTPKVLPSERDASCDRGKDMVSLKKANMETRANVKLLAETTAALDLRINALEKSAAAGTLEFQDFHMFQTNLARRNSKDYLIPASSRASLESLDSGRVQNDLHIRTATPSRASRSLASGTVSNASRSPSPNEIQQALGPTEISSGLRRPVVPTVDMVRLRSQEAIPGRVTPPLVTPTKSSTPIAPSALPEGARTVESGHSISATVARSVDNAFESVSATVTPGRSKARAPLESFAMVTKSHSVSIPTAQAREVPAHVINSPKLSPERISQAPSVASLRRGCGPHGVSTPRLGVQQRSAPQSPHEEFANSRRALLIKPPGRSIASPSPSQSAVRSTMNGRSLLTPR